MFRLERGFLHLAHGIDLFSLGGDQSSRKAVFVVIAVQQSIYTKEAAFRIPAFWIFTLVQSKGRRQDHESRN